MKNFKIAKIQQNLKNKNIDSLIINRTDEFLNEYIPKDAERLFWATDFSGSAGRAIISQNKANLFVDGRYTFQAKEQINNLTSFLGFKLFDEQEPAVSGTVSQDFIMRPGQGIQRFSGGDTVAGVKDPAMFAALAGNRGMSETGTKQVALLQALVNNSNAQMSEIIRTNKEKHCNL